MNFLRNIMQQASWIALILAVLACLAGWWFWPTVAPVFPQAPVTVQRQDGTQIHYMMDIATTQAQQEYGLMYRKSLPDDYAMLFVWNEDAPLNMWMKNTFVSLDMLFVRRDGTISKIITNTEPLSTAILSSDQPSRGVIEFKADTVAQKHFKVGDKVLYSAFSQ